MDRREFIKSCGYVCVGGTVIAAALQSCTTTKMVSGTISHSNLLVALADFEMKTKNEQGFRKYIIVQNEALKFPICVYRFSAIEYTALYLQCTHQGAELQVFGDKIQCPAHGSEFNNQGQVENGPATEKLRSFPVQIENEQLKIALT